MNPIYFLMAFILQSIAFSLSETLFQSERQMVGKFTGDNKMLLGHTWIRAVLTFLIMLMYFSLQISLVIAVATWFANMIFDDGYIATKWRTFLERKVSGNDNARETTFVNDNTGFHLIVITLFSYIISIGFIA